MKEKIRSIPEYENDNNYVDEQIIPLTQQDGTVVHAFALRLFFSKLTYCNCEWIASRDI